MVATVQHHRHHPRVFPVTGFRTTVLLRWGPYEPVGMGRLRGVQSIHQQYESSASTSRNGLVQQLALSGRSLSMCTYKWTISPSNIYSHYPFSAVTDCRFAIFVLALLIFSIFNVHRSLLPKFALLCVCVAKNSSYFNLSNVINIDL